MIRIRVTFADFDDFWEFEHRPGRAVRQHDRGDVAGEREQFKARLREQLPIAADGSIAYEAFANAVKGRVPA